MYTHPVSIEVACEKDGHRVKIKGSDAWTELEEKFEEWLHQYPWDLWFEEVDENREYFVQVDAEFISEEKTRLYPGTEYFEVNNITLIKENGEVFYNE